jgi:hypothetical protein
LRDREAGSAFEPYAEGYFPSAAFMAWAFAPKTDGGLSGYGGGN